jgi:pimeloyl-ACP methyl ester carboxylesterase
MNVDDTLEVDDYDEFGLLHENAEEWDQPFAGRPDVSRHYFEVAPDRRLSYIKWGSDDPELVFLHGGGQNGHTWDYIALFLGRSAICVDLPGHGRSYRRDDGNYGPWENVIALEAALREIAPNAVAIVGMSLGGATATHMAAKRPDLCRKAVIVDVTPSVNNTDRSMTTMERGTVGLIGAQPVYETFEEMAESAIALSPYRGASGVRRGVRHNSYRAADGKWTWRYDLMGGRSDQVEANETAAPDRNWADFTRMWDEVTTISVPTMLVRGGESKFVLDEDVEEFQKRLPSVRYEVVPGAGHAVQSDQPLVLVALIEDFVFGA